MAFDFYEAANDLAPAEAALSVVATADGVCNAVAFWFELQLDERATLSTSPYAAKARGCGPGAGSRRQRPAAVRIARRVPAQRSVLRGRRACCRP